MTVSWTPASLTRVNQWLQTRDETTEQEPAKQQPRFQQSSRAQQKPSALQGGHQRSVNSLTSFKPTIERHFYRVDEHGTRMGRTRYTASKGVTPMDVVRKLATRLLPRSRSLSLIHI